MVELLDNDYMTHLTVVVLWILVRLLELFCIDNQKIPTFLKGLIVNDFINLMANDLIAKSTPGPILL